MKYFVAYPLLFDCNLRCSYCFHKVHFESNFVEKQKFTLNDWVRFRDTHLNDADEILVHFHGGEPFLPQSTNMMRAFLKKCSPIERIDILTNGLQDQEQYAAILPWKHLIHRIGFTFHRKVIGNSKSMVKKFEDNVLFMHRQGVPVYVKELLVSSMRDKILENRRKWQSLDIGFSIQDFKGEDRGVSKEEYENYTALDVLYIDAEYKHGGDFCTCRKGYKNVLIRGGWQSGDVLACFEDPVVVGNLQENTFNPNFTIKKDYSEGRMRIEGVPEIYRGDVNRDMPNDQNANYYIGSHGYD